MKGSQSLEGGPWSTTEEKNHTTGCNGGDRETVILLLIALCLLPYN